MIPGIQRKYSMVRRYREIIDTLIKYEFGHIVERLGIKKPVLFKSKLKSGYRHKERNLSSPERARKVLEELGPTFIKFGQILSTRRDLIPPRYIQELEKLQDSVPPFSFDIVQNIIRDELGADIDHLFSNFEKNPIAAASIGQVHSAKLHDGSDVVVKVQRPDIKKRIESDLDILYSIAGFIEEYIEESRMYRPKEIVDQLARTISAELDYTQEARNISIFSNNFKHDPHIYIPEVYEEYSTRRVLTIERIKGIKGNDYAKIEKMDIDVNKIATYGAEAFMKQIFEDGFFHADMHPGNIFIINDEKIALIDFGMVGYISEDMRYALIDALFLITNREISQFIEVMRDFGIISGDVDSPALKADLEFLMYKYYGRSLKQVNMPDMIHQVFAILRKHRARIPPNISLLLKGVVTISGLGTRLVPDFNVTVIAEPYAKKVMRERVRPDKIARGAFTDLMNFIRMLHKFPTQASHILSSAEKGNFLIKLELHWLQQLVEQINTASNRLAFSLILSSIIIGSSLIIQTGIEPHLWGLPVLGLIGFLTAGILGLILVIYILRSGNI
ncbi:ABC-1 domain protein [Methanosalsum zhilinae DSM 4017]|uniref:ABC-1 domain protein n=1 Tax=Methanosalsum zhilinae (strain DSM 4017 / NBRC 107636 / OCM 62 / WeN5) TaxID=679901 RepID=F7XPA2_METZD|nr:AarF/ABC1/UbiB kinase family protein [Methanosalsum zhilinae]AEH60229.1 ABC-1 domain protein [Methanosalsum zhilinae DSM 4017]